ncbi:MAG: helix-turn-helix transcriptional regulator [Chloroflexi bacterium]|nr:helix-turn-helix transcriptional regulator [Chloroflexota bacterium]
MSQEDLAEAVERDQRAISEYENGKRRLAAVDLPLFATVLQVPISHFFEGSASPDQDAALLNYFHLLPDDQARHSAIVLMQTFAYALMRAASSTER